MHFRDKSNLNVTNEIISVLVLRRDREILNEGLNVDLLIQQFRRGWPAWRSLPDGFLEP